MKRLVLDPQDIAELLPRLDKPAVPEELAGVVPSGDLSESDYQFYKIKRLTYFSDEPRREVLENVYSAMRFPGASVVYLICGHEQGVDLYLGVVRNHRQAAPEIRIKSLAESILKPSFEGNFRGSSLEPLSDQRVVPDQLKSLKHTGLLQGTVGNQKDGENSFFQGVDRIIDIMQGKRFCLVVAAAAVGHEELIQLESTLHDAYSLLAPLCKVSMQKGSNTGRSESSGGSYGYNKGGNSSRTDGGSEGESKGSTKTTSQGDMSDSGNEGSSKGKSWSDTTGSSEGVSYGKNWGSSDNSGESQTFSTELHNRKAQQWLSYIDEVLLPRVDYGRSRGLFVTNISLFADTHQTLLALGNTALSVFSGNAGNCYPLQFCAVTEYPQLTAELRKLQVPVKPLSTKQRSNLQFGVFHQLKSRLIGHDFVALGALYSPKELSLIAGLPQKEVTGVSLSEEVEFGLNPPAIISAKERLPLGHLVQDGRIHQNIDVCLDVRELNKHIFVAGVTGSGKTTTCQHLLRQSRLPFMVIEPAKTEYRSLVEEYPDLIVFTPGRDELCPFRLNPLELMPGESISARADTIKASFSASFDMEAAIPQVLEAAIYRSYEKMGWNLVTSKHRFYNAPFAAGIYPFPVLADLLDAAEDVINEQGFDDRLKNDYTGSIKARLQGLLVGAKRQLLNTLKSVDFTDLIKRKVVIELDEIRNGAEKSLIMGFVLTNLVQAIKNEHQKNPQFRHLTLIEEAHRLLSNSGPGESSNRKQGVEMFADMLAEIRKYGEGLIIVDQIPNKLTPEVLKSTNTKIVHKLFAQDDKEAIGNTMALDSKQQQYLSRLDVGHTVVFSQGWQKAVQIKIVPELDVQETGTNETGIERIMVSRIQHFYAKHGSDGLLPMLTSQKDRQFSADEIGRYMRFALESDLLTEYNHYLARQNLEPLRLALKDGLKSTGSIDMVIDHLTYNIYLADEKETMSAWRTKVSQLVNDVLSGETPSLMKSNLDTKSRRK